MSVKFFAEDYTSEDSFEKAEYEFTGSTSAGWEIRRNGQPWLDLAPGYRLLETVKCGICSTDLARRFLPFPLPQVIGHEVVAMDPETGEKFVIEINDTPQARNEELDVFSKSGLHTHSPGRMVLGIDRLPGGFGKYILAPVEAAVPYGDLGDDVAVLVEPFAASLQAVHSSPPEDGWKVAVLGPRRLGSLVIAALAAYRKSSGRNFEIAGLARHSHLLELSVNMGADRAVDVSRPFDEKFDIIYDTTGSVAGFETALAHAREVHLKSTNGQMMAGLGKLTELVVDELSILPYSPGNMEFSWPEEKRKNRLVYAAPGVDTAGLPEGYEVVQCSVSEAEAFLAGRDGLPRFDIAIASSLEEIDAIIRPNPEHENSLLRPRGAVLYKGSDRDNPFVRFVQGGGRLRSSRCGDFRKAVELLSANRNFAEKMASLLITVKYPVAKLPEAFAEARKSENIKIVVEHGN